MRLRDVADEYKEGKCVKCSQVDRRGFEQYYNLHPKKRKMLDNQEVNIKVSLILCSYSNVRI